ncbi:MAG: hypothetical protein ACXVH7_07345 [Thermoanaerobaculia bacterium]
MTRQKDLKRVIRTRMQKTGESYTTARLHLVKTKPEAKPDYAALAGLSDAAIKKGTGCTWERWVKTLDHRGAQNMSHTEIAKLAHAYKAGDWWAQTVAVGYERIRGLRARGQQRGGRWGATKSKTFATPVATLFKAWSDAKTRKKWLPENVKIRTANAPKTMRITWEDGTIIAVGFTDKGAKSAVAIEHAGLASKDDADRIKKLWSERFEALAKIL